MKYTAAFLCAALCAGCLSVKTESEIKPIHITMDVNLKVDKALDQAFREDNAAAKENAGGTFKAVRDAMDRRAAGVTNRALLEARDGATDDDRVLVAKENARRLELYSDIAKKNGVAIETVQKRRAAKIRDMVPAGVWIQDESGAWAQKR